MRDDNIKKRMRQQERGREKWERGNEINDHSFNERVLMFISQVSAHWTKGWCGEMTQSWLLVLIYC